MAVSRYRRAAADALALAVRVGRARSSPPRVSIRLGSEPTGGLGEEGEGEGSMLESTGENIVDPRLDVFRDFVNSLDVRLMRRTARADRGGQPLAHLDDRANHGGSRVTVAHIASRRAARIADGAEDHLRLAPVASRRSGIMRTPTSATFLPLPGA